MNALAKYLDAKGIDFTTFAEAIGVHRSSVARFCDGTRVPALDTAQRIHKATHGKVKPESFFSEASQAAE